MPIVYVEQREQVDRASRGFGTFQAGLSSQVAAPPQISTVILNQEQPWHPPGFQSPGGAGYFRTVGVGITGAVFLKQEQPWAASPYVKPPPPGPNVRAPVADRVLTVQENPWHPSSLAQSRGIAPSVNPPPLPRETIGSQEQPWHPVSFEWFLPASGGVLIMPVPARNNIIGNQEQPYHPTSFFTPGVHIARPAGRQRLFFKQEIPFHPTSFARAGVGRNVISPEVRSIFVPQYQPDHPPSRFNPAVVLTTKNSAQRDTIILTQEIPWHPLPFVLQSFRVQNVASPDKTGIFIGKQEAPWHPPAFESFRRPDTLVVTAPGPTRGERTVQEQPWHPSSFVNPSFRAQNVIAAQRGHDYIALIQETPYHPGPILRNDAPPSHAVLNATLRFEFERQEETPFHVHPRPFVNPGNPISQARLPAALIVQDSSPYLAAVGLITAFPGIFSRPAPQVSINQIIPPREPLVDFQRLSTRSWWRFFQALSVGFNSLKGTVSTATASITTINSTLASLKAQVNAITSSLHTPYIVSGSYTGATLANMIVQRHLFVQEITFPVNFINSYATADIAATALTTYVINKNGVQVGTMAFQAGGKAGSFTAASINVFGPGDLLTIVAPASPDATLANVYWSLRGVA